MEKQMIINIIENRLSKLRRFITIGSRVIEAEDGSILLYLSLLNKQQRIEYAYKIQAGVKYKPEKIDYIIRLMLSQIFNEIITGGNI